MDIVNAPKKRGQKAGKKHLNDLQKGKIQALLELKLYSTEEIGKKVGCSHDLVGKVAKKLGIELIGNSKKTEEYKMRLAEQFGALAERMIGAIRDTPDAELKKISLAQKIMAAGMSTDKLLALTKPKEDPNAQAQVVNMTWLSLVQQNLPQRAKDGPPTIDQSTFAPPAEPTPAVEDAQIIKNEEKDDGSKTNE